VELPKISFQRNGSEFQMLLLVNFTMIAAWTWPLNRWMMKCISFWKHDIQVHKKWRHNH